MVRPGYAGVGVTIDADIGVRRGALDIRAQLSVRRGELLAILGPNGAGKTSILRCLAGLTPIDTGRIELDGRIVDDPASDTFVAPEHRPIGVVFQDYLLFPHLSVLDNVAYAARARGAKARDARRAARPWLERFGLDGHAAARPAALSGGQAQRVALARALATDPAVVLLDEPLAALDVATRATVRRELRHHLAAFDGARVMITHDPVDAYALADRVAILEEGRITQVGTIAEVTARPRSRYVADLVGVNLIAGHVTGTTLRTDHGVTVVVADAPAGDAHAVVHPRSVTVSIAEPPVTSARNTWAATVAAIDPLGERARLSLEGPFPLVAEITRTALDSLALRPGDLVYAVVKATDVTVYER